MKKRFLAILLAMVMVLALIPTSAFAADSDFVIENGKLVKYTGADTDVVIPEGVLIIGSGVFKDLPLTSVTFPSTLLQIETNAFNHCRALTNITLPGSLVSIGDSAFSGCTQLKNVTMSEGLKTLGWHVFSNCLSLTDVVFPASLTYAGNCAFQNDVNLTNIYYGGSQAQWKAVEFRAGNDSVNSANLHYNSTGPDTPFPKYEPVKVLDGNANGFQVENGELVKYTGPGGDVVIPEGVLIIQAEVFQELSLNSVTFPSTLRQIGVRSFSKCVSLTSITLPEGLIWLDDSAFSGCSGLKDVTISNGLKYMDWHVFSECLSLKSITLPASLTYVGNASFFNDVNLTDVYYTGSEAQWKAITFKIGNDYLTKATIHYNSAGPNDPSQPNPGTNPNPGTTTPSDVHFTRANVYHQGQFTDVPANQWYTQSVSDAFELGLMKGNSATTFGVNGNVTVAEAITMACRIHAIYTTGSDSAITAQTGGQWYQPYLDYARQNKIISDAYYNSDVTQKATRAQFAEIFANSLPEEALSPINNIADGKIPDVPMSANYAGAVYKLYRAGILAGGDATGTFSPFSYISRVEAAAIVSRMAESNSRRTFSL